MRKVNPQEVESKILRRIFAEYFIAHQVRDSHIDEAAQAAVLEMAKGDTASRMKALVLTAGVKSGMIAEIRSIGEAAPNQPLHLQEREAFLSGPIGGLSAPSVFFRDELRADSASLARALSQSIQDAWKDVSKDAVAHPKAEPGTPRLSCLVYCGLCAVAMADEIPFDEIYPCMVCLTCAADARGSRVRSISKVIGCPRGQGARSLLLER